MHKTIIMASTIGSLMSMYDDCERTKSINKIIARIEKFMRKRYRVRQKEYVEAVLIGDKVWQDTIDKYKDENEKFSIEGIHTVMVLWNEDHVKLSKHVGLTQKVIDAYTKLDDGKQSVDAEMNSYELAEFMIDKINENLNALSCS
jgi:hypothetical protein